MSTRYTHFQLTVTGGTEDSYRSLVILSKSLYLCEKFFFRACQTALPAFLRPVEGPECDTEVPAGFGLQVISELKDSVTLVGPGVPVELVPRGEFSIMELFEACEEELENMIKGWFDRFLCGASSGA